MRKISFVIVLALFVPLLAAFPETKTFTFSSDKTTIVMAEGKEKTVLTGNARLTSESSDITADKIELFGKDLRYARCSGTITVLDKEQGIRIKTENLFYDRDKKRLVIKAYAEMVDQKNEVVVKGSYFENLADKEITIIEIGVRILQATDDGTLTARSEFALFDRKNNTLELTGVPVVYKNNNVFKASRIVVDLDTDEIQLFGKVSGSVTSEEE